MNQLSQLSDGLERINTTDLLPFPETTADIVAFSASEEMAFNQFISEPQHHQPAIHHHQPELHHQNSFYTVPPSLDHLNVTPCLDDLDTDFRFEVEVPMDEKEKKLWFYDAAHKRLFVKGDQHLSAFVSCRTANQKLNVRLMAAYTSLADVKKPVNRCPNHKEQCRTANRDHIVHCDNDGAVYMGQENGDVFMERLSVLIPLKKTHQMRQYEEVIREEIVFSFTCLNSCSGISRRPTALIFTLENESMEILGRTVMNFRACTSPKRDFDNDRKKRGLTTTGEDMPSAKRPMLVKNTDGTVVKTEPQEASSQESEPPSPSGEEVLTLVLPDKQTSMQILCYVQDYMSGEVTRGKPVNKKYFKQIRKQIEEHTKELEKSKVGEGMRGSL